MHRSLKASLLAAGLTLLFAGAGFAQEEKGRSLFEIPARVLIDAPTAGTLPRGCFDVVLRVYPNGGILSSTAIGLSNRFMVGLSYGADGIIAETNAHWNPRIEFNLKLRIIDEEYYLPAVSLGFISQGYGSYSKEWKRYAYKSKGFYAVMSRSLYFYKSSVGGHFGVNYTTEGEGDETPSFFFGFDSQFNNNISLLLEYDVALNDDAGDQPFGKGHGYLNAGIKWLFSENLEIEAILENLINNRRAVTSFSRGLRFTYIEFF